jgi:hypothetical protein
VAPTGQRVFFVGVEQASLLGPTKSDRGGYELSQWVASFVVRMLEVSATSTPPGPAEAHIDDRRDGLYAALSAQNRRYTTQRGSLLVTMEAAGFFTDLSVRLGFTLPAEAVERLTESPPTNVEDFTDEILRAEGLDPLTTDSALRGQVRKLVREYVGEPEWPPPSGRRGHPRR